MKYRPYGLTEADYKEPHESIIPDRVQKLIDIYHKNKIEYNWTEEDKNERIFEYRQSLRPDTYAYNLEAVYRVRDPADKSKEYYFYQKKGKVLNQNDDPEYSNSHTYGYVNEIVCELRWNPNWSARLRQTHMHFSTNNYLTI